MTAEQVLLLFVLGGTIKYSCIAKLIASLVKGSWSIG